VWFKGSISSFEGQDSMAPGNLFQIGGTLWRSQSFVPLSISLLNQHRIVKK